MTGSFHNPSMHQSRFSNISTAIQPFSSVVLSVRVLHVYDNYKTAPGTYANVEYMYYTTHWRWLVEWVMSIWPELGGSRGTGLPWSSPIGTSLQESRPLWCYTTFQYWVLPWWQMVSLALILIHQTNGNKEGNDGQATIHKKKIITQHLKMQFV